MSLTSFLSGDSTADQNSLNEIIDKGQVPESDLGDIIKSSVSKSKYDAELLVYDIRKHSYLEHSVNLPGSASERDLDDSELLDIDRTVISEIVSSEMSAYFQEIAEEKRKNIYRSRAVDLHQADVTRQILESGSNNEAKGNGNAIAHVFEAPLASADEQIRPQYKYEWIMPDAFYKAEELTCSWVFGGFTYDSPVRMKCFLMYQSIEWSTFFAFVALFYAVYLAVAPEIVLQFVTSTAAHSNGQTEFQWTDALEFFCTGCLLLEVVIGMIAVGFIKHPTCWLRCSNYHRLDFFVLLATLLEYGLVFIGYRSPNLRALRLLRVFRVLTAMEYFEGVKLVLLSLTIGFPALVNVFAIMVLFICCFAVFGIALYKESYRRYCVVINQTVPVCASDFTTNWTSTCNFTTDVNLTQTILNESALVAGGYPFIDYCKIYYNTTPEEYMNDYPYDQVRGYHHSCQLRDFKNGLPIVQTCWEFPDYFFNNGFSHFDSIWAAICVVFQVSTRDGYADIFMVVWGSEPGLLGISYLFFVSQTVLLTFLVYGIFSAIIIGTSRRRSDEDEGESEGEEDEKEEKQSDHRGNVVESQTEGNVAKEEQEKPERNLSAISKVPKGQEDGTKSDDLVLVKKAEEWHPESEDETESKIAKTVDAIIKSTFWQAVIVSAIIVNSIAIAADQYDAPPAWSEFCHWTYLCINIIFLIHLGLNLRANGTVIAFLRSQENQLEVLTVVLGLVGLAIGSQNLLLLSALRVYKLMAYLPTLANLLTSSIMKSPILFRLLIFMIIVSFTFAVTSRYAIGDSMDSSTLQNFSSLSTAWLTLFKILLQDNWSNTLFSAMMAQTDPSTEIIVGAFIYTWFLLAAIVFNNLFIALIVSNFEVKETLKRLREPGYVAMFTHFCKNAAQYLGRQGTAIADKLTRKPRARHTPAWAAGSIAPSEHEAPEIHPEMSESLEQSPAVIASLRSRMIARNTIRSRIVEACTREIPPVEEFVEVQARVLFLFSAKSRIRRFAGWLGRQRLYNNIVLLAILGSCFFLTILPPYDDMPKEDQLLPLPHFISDLANTIFILIFLADFVIKILAQGLLFTSKGYLRESGWNVLDTVVLILGLIDAAGIFKGNIGKLAKLGRALRPIRLMMRIRAMRSILNTLLKTMGPVLYVAEFVLFNFLAFGLIGMGLFNGNFFFCTDPNVNFPEGKAECSGTHADPSTSDGTTGVLFPSAWVAPTENFDTFGSSLLLLFRFSLIGGGTVNTINNAMAITDLNLNPVPYFSPQNFLFFFGFLLSTSLLAMNIFLGFIFDGFNLLRGATEKDKSYNRYMRLVTTKAPTAIRYKVPKSSISVVLRATLATKEYIRFSNLCVALNFAFLASDHAGATDDFMNMLYTQNLVFYVQLLVEVIMSLLAWGPLEFFSDYWRILDFFVVCCASLDYIVVDPTANNIAKAARLMRVVRVMKVLDAVRVILETLISCIPSLVNVLILMVLVFSMFACLLSQTFGTTKNGNMIGYFHSANFKTWLNALHSCFQLVIMAEWVDLMMDSMVSPPFCTPKFDNATVYGYEGVNYSWGDCGTTSAPLIFVLLKITCEAILLNLIIGMVLDNFSFLTDELMEGEDQFEFGNKGPSTRQFDHLLAVFVKISGGGPYISLSSVGSYMNRIPHPLGHLREDGKIQSGQKDRWEENLVRAEMNVILLNERKLKFEASKSRWNLLTFPSQNAEQKYLNGVHFRDLLHALLIWRCPQMVPDSIKISRAQRDAKILEVSESLVIMRFMNNVCAEKMKLDLQRQLRARYVFMNWTKTETYQQRRLQFKENRSVRPLYVEDSVDIKITLLTLLYEDTEYHHESLVSSKLKATSQLSLEYFRRRSVTDIAVLKFIDPKHAEKGYCIADFTECKWNGWSVKKWQKDIFYEPGTDIEDADDDVQEEALGWTKIDFIMQVRTRVRSKSTIQYRYQGSLKDIHSFVTSDSTICDERGNHSDSPGRYCIRFNLGLYEGGNSISSNSAAKITKKSYDVVLELVGYLKSGEDNDGDTVHEFQTADGRLQDSESTILSHKS